MLSCNHRLLLKTEHERMLVPNGGSEFKENTQRFKAGFGEVFLFGLEFHICSRVRESRKRKKIFQQ